MTDWSEANCRNGWGATVDMFPEDGRGVERAKRVCHGCPVFAACEREHSEENHGVWFGTSERERRRRRDGRYGRPVHRVRRHAQRL